MQVSYRYSRRTSYKNCNFVFSLCDKLHPCWPRATRSTRFIHRLFYNAISAADVINVKLVWKKIVNCGFVKVLISTQVSVVALAYWKQDGGSKFLRNVGIIPQHYTVSHPEDGSSKFLRNVGIIPQHYAVSQPRKFELDCSLLWKLQISKLVNFTFVEFFVKIARIYFVSNC
jgi:hypothetical protein